MPGQKKESGLHESYDRQEEVAGSSDRAFGLTVGGILIAIAAFRLYRFEDLDWVNAILFGIGGPLVLLGAAFPRLLAPLNWAWTKLGLLLFKIVNPLVMGLIFFVTVAPIGLAMRLFGKDPLRLKLSPDAQSYWIERAPPGPEPETMKNQF